MIVCDSEDGKIFFDVKSNANNNKNNVLTGENEKIVSGE